MEYLATDPHFGHKNILTLENRPFKSIQEMDKYIISSYNSVVSKFDTLYILGDFSFGNKEYTKNIVQQLNGRKILVMGNHCRRKSKKWFHDVGFDSVIDGGLFLRDKFLCTHEPTNKIDTSEKLTPDSIVNIHGHTHSVELDSDVHINICPEVSGYKPISLDKLEEIFNIKWD